MQIWQPNQTIKDNRFLIQKKLGIGGFGITYLAEDRQKQQRVVIKTLNANRQDAPDFRQVQEKFVNEALKLSQFRHLHIVRVQELIQEGDLWGIVMEYIDGVELSDCVLERGKLEEAEALDYIDKIAQALDYVHQQGVLHRDVKPNNIMLRQIDRYPILIDFGLAREFIDGKSLSMTNSLTHGYAPPEQYDRHGKFAAYTDVYALAATLYHLLTGQIPIPANYRQYPNVNLTTPKDYDSGITDRVSHAIMQGMAIDFRQRPQNMTEFRELLGLVTKSANKEPILDAEAYYERGKVKYKSGDKQGALADFNKAIELDPNFAKFYGNRGSVKSELGDKQGALADYNKAIELDPNYTYAYNSRGVDKYELGDKQGALADYNKAIELNPNSANASYNRGVVKRDLGDKQGALADYNKAIELDPNFPHTYHSRGVVKRDLGDKQGALADYNKAIQLDPNYSYAYKDRGYAKSKLGDRQGALSDFNKAIQRDNNTDAYHGRGIVKRDLGDRQGALADYNKAIELDPNFTYAYNNRGIVKCDLGDQKGALADYNKAIELDPNYSYAYNNRGHTKRELGDRQGALADFNKAIELKPNFTAAYDGRGFNKYELGDRQGALADYNRAAKLYRAQGETKEYERVLRIIKKL
jgi:tetratricopeptide (TPR) repeat protein